MQEAYSSLRGVRFFFDVQKTASAAGFGGKRLRRKKLRFFAGGTAGRSRPYLHSMDRNFLTIRKGEAHMNSIANPSAATLDRIRRNQGSQACRDFFTEYEKKGRAAAIRLADDRALSFGTFFTILPELRRLQLQEELSERGRTAAHLCETVLSGQKTGMGICPEMNGGCQDTLLWIFLTGALDDGLDGDFDRILDASAAVLAKTYHDESFLPALVSLMFRRNRNGSYVHDLAWAFLQSHSSKALQLAADYLRSENSDDVGLAEELLHLPHTADARSRKEQYASYLKWLEENAPYLLFDCAGFNATAQPHVCSIDLTAKYLGHAAAELKNSPRDGLTDSERSMLAAFANMRDEEKEALAHFSAVFHKHSPARWKRWLNIPLDLQLQIAKKNGRDGR